MAEFVGPALPPGYKKRTAGEGGDLIGPELPGGWGQQKQGRRAHNENLKSAVSMGPELPPDFKASSSKSETPDDCIGPQLPPAPSSRSPAMFGPTLPPHLRTSPTETCKEETTGTTLGPCPPPTIVKLSDKDATGSREEASLYGPSLPPDLVSASPKVFGPSLPPGLGEKPDEQPWSRDPTPPPSSSEEEEDFIGPLPVAAEKEGSIELQRKRLEIEARSREMRNRLENKDRPTELQQPKREEWMTELPPEIKPLGLGPRKFRTGVCDPGDRSVWTETPADRQRKAQEAQEGQVKKAPVRGGEVEYASVSSRDKKLASQVEEYNKQHRSQSLLDMHRKRRRAEERFGKEEERRPFNRETDLELPRNLMTSAKRRALVEDSVKALGSKFTHGKRSFL